jgi:hypothetical protein
MTRYCDIHGAIEVADGPPNQFFKCPQMLGDKPCNTQLTVQPHARVVDPPMGDFYSKGQINTPSSLPQVATPPAREKRQATIMNQAAFLAAYGRLGSITEASKAADIDRKRHYEWLVNDPEYAGMFDEAHQVAVQHMVDTAFARAMGLSGEASDRLMIKFLESIPSGRQPRGWQFNPVKRHEISGPGGGPIETNEVNARDALSSRIASLTTPTDTPSGS